MLLDEFNNKLQAAYKNMPTLSSKIPEIVAHKDDFMRLDLKAQVNALLNFLNVFTCSKVFGNLTAFVPRSSVVGRASFSSNISNLKSIFLIVQSPTGLYEKEIDLKAYSPEK